MNRILWFSLALCVLAIVIWIQADIVREACTERRVSWDRQLNGEFEPVHQRLIPGCEDRVARALRRQILGASLAAIGFVLGMVAFIVN